MFYARLPTPQEAASAGFTVADYEEEAEVWPENWPAWHLFTLMQSQWESGFSGPTGLKYSVLFEFMDRKGIDDCNWWQMLDDIRAMEDAAINAMREGT